jgi:recombination associated protein RdgC
MPIRRGAVSCSRFRIEGAVPKDVKKWLTRALTTRAFEPIDPKGDEDRASGFVELEDDRATAFSAGAVFDGLYALFAWRVEKIRLPASALRGELAEWARKFEAKKGRAPGRREKGEQKDLIRRTLRAKTPPVASVSDVSYELPVGEVLIWATSVGIVEEVQTALEEKLEVRLIPRVPASFVSPSVLDSLAPTPELFEAQEAGR